MRSSFLANLGFRMIDLKIMTTQFFFEELQRLIKIQPKRPTFVLNSENCEMAHNIQFGKNLLECFDSQKCENCVSVSDGNMVVDCISADYIFESQNLYGCVGLYKCFNCFYCDDTEQTQEAYYSSTLTGCHDVFGCVNLTNKSFCIFNRQFSEQEYREKVALLKKLPPETIFEIVEKIKKQLPITQTHERYNENTNYGHNIYYDKNCYLLFDSSWNENCCYLYDSFYNKNCLDMTYSGEDMQSCYETIDSKHAFNCNYLFQSSSCQDSSYLFNCMDVKNSLGCVGLSHKQFCILNRQFAKEDYERIVKQVLDELKTKNLSWANIIY